MIEQLGFWGVKERKEFKNISEPEVRVKNSNLLIEFLVTKDNGDQIELRFIFDLNKDKNQKPKIEKSIKRSYSRAFISEASKREVSEVEPKYFNKVLKIAYAIFKEKYKEYQDEQKRKSIQPKLPLK